MTRNTRIRAEEIRGNRLSDMWDIVFDNERTTSPVRERVWVLACIDDDKWNISDQVVLELDMWDEDQYD